ncbi:uncharacterized protein [Apostichopus japonicus]|uniref:uncharacterized protein isoform X2 n=1 Tax=Stichopus japonicus TaxID=307972 RepID=UPI003AB7B3E0
MTSPELDTDEEYIIIAKYLSSGLYPEKSTLTLKRSIRRRSKSFKLTGDADLVYVGPHGNEVPRAVITGEVAKTHKIQSLHEGFGGGHFGRDKTLEKVTSRYYWRGLANDVLEYVKQCEACQKSNNTFDKKVAKLHPIPVTSVWHQVGVDMIGPLPETISGNKYVITLCDYFSKWPEAVAVRNKTAKTVANFLFETMARFGCMKIVISDQGGEFVNALNKSLFDMTGVDHRVSSSYHPQTNGLDERFNQTLQRALIKVVNNNQDDWDEMLSSILMGYRTAKHASTGLSPFVVMFGREPLLPVDIEESMVHPESPTDCSDAQQERVYQSMAKSREKIKGLVKGNISKAQERQKKNFDKRHQSEKNFKVGSSVLVRNARKDVRRGGKLENSWLGPYKVKDVNEKGLFTLINSSTGLPLKKKFNSILLKEFHTNKNVLIKESKPEASIISTNTPNELLPNLGNTCYMAAALQLFEGSGIIQHYDGHSSELMEVIKALFHATSSSTSWDPCLARLKQILPEFDSTAQEDALEFLGALYTSSCTSCNQSQCKLLDEYFFLHTTNEMKCTSCNETWHSGANSYPVIPIYPSNKSYMSRLSMQGHLEIFLDCQDLEGLCDSCGSSDGLLVSPSITCTPEVISIGISRWGGDKLKKNFQTIDIEAEVRLSGVLYELYGVLIHEGTSSTSGHYSCAKRVKDNSWVHMNDGTCTVIAKSAIDSSNVCGAFYKKVPDNECMEDEEEGVQLHTRNVKLVHYMADIVQHLNEIMSGKLGSQRHDVFLTGNKLKHTYLIGAGAVSAKLREALTTELRSHYNTTPDKTRGPILPKDLFTLRQQFFFKFPEQLHDRLKKLRKFEVQLSYLNDVLVPHAVEHLYHLITGCTESEAAAACSQLRNSLQK